MSKTRADILKASTDLEAKLKGKLFLGGSKASAEDVKEFNNLIGAENSNVARWIKHISSFPASVRDGWGNPTKALPPLYAGPMGVSNPTPTQAAAAPKAEKSATKSPAKTRTPATKSPATKSPATRTPATKSPATRSPAARPAAAPSKDDDDVDLFGDVTEEEQAALDAKKAADAAAAAKKPKKEVIAKSSILIDIKPWEDTTDLAELAKKLHEVVRPGLVWGDFKLVPVAYGLKKLQQLIVIEDDKISGEDLEDMILGFEDYVQSMDIQAWNKI